MERHCELCGARTRTRPRRGQQGGKGVCQAGLGRLSDRCPEFKFPRFRVESVEKGFVTCHPEPPRGRRRIIIVLCTDLHFVQMTNVAFFHLSLRLDRCRHLGYNRREAGCAGDATPTLGTCREPIGAHVNQS